MEERIRPTKSGLFTIEILIAVGVFALCAAICIGLFVRAELISRDSRDLTRAVSEARNAAEVYKAEAGDLAKAAELLGGELSADGGSVILKYESEGGREYTLSLAEESPAGAADGLKYAGIEVRESTGGAEEEPILSWDIAAFGEEARP